MTPGQHNTLTQLAQLGLQKLTDDANAALLSCAPASEREATDEPPEAQEEPS